MSVVQGVRTEIEQFVLREAQMLDDFRLREWLGLFADTGLYWVPVDDSKGPAESVSIIRDDKLCREERVFHALETRSPAQTPRSNTVHVVGGMTIDATGPNAYRARSSQVIYEMREGDFRQSGLGNVQSHVATVTHDLVRTDGALKIALKKVLLLNRRGALGNLTFFV